MADDPYEDYMATVKPEPGVFKDGDPGLDSIPSHPASHVKPEPDVKGNEDKDGVDQPIPETNFLEQLVSKTSAEELEAGVKIGLQLLDSLKIPLNDAMVVGDTQVAQAAAWLKSIQQLQDSAKPARTVVGVVYVPTPQTNVTVIFWRDADPALHTSKWQYWRRQELYD